VLSAGYAGTPRAGAPGAPTAARVAAPARSFLGRVLGVRADARHLSARREESVAWRLKRLPRSWRVFDDPSLDANGHNPDQIVIGPGGVYVLNAKTLTGNVWVSDRVMRVNGKPVDYLRKARREAHAVAGRLAESGVQIEVVPVVVVTADRLTIRAQPSDMWVMESRVVARWMTSRPLRLAPEDVARLAAFV
jgi:hypothetical protein